MNWKLFIIYSAFGVGATLFFHKLFQVSLYESCAMVALALAICALSKEEERKD